jgi:uncharacterized membrane protein YuzA (DUF378 family)
MARVVNAIDWLALVLVIIGALNWLLVGIFGLDIVATALGGTAAIGARIVYVIVGLAGLWLIYTGYKLATYEPMVARRPAPATPT